MTLPARGLNLAAYVAGMQARGAQCALSADGSHAWVPGAPGEMQRLPIGSTAPTDITLLDALLRRPRVWAVSYVTEPSASRRANCFEYVCDDPGYDLEHLTANARSVIRRGLRNFNIRLCTWEELAEQGFRAQADTAIRHGYAAPSAAPFAQGPAPHRLLACCDIWGAWRADKLEAWLTVSKIDDWAVINATRSCTAVLNLYPNNALLYAATRWSLAEEKRAYVTYGLSSIQMGASRLSLHNFKLRMGYRAVPRHREFLLHPSLRALVSSQLLSWGWDQLARMHSRSPQLRKLAGISRLLSGRERAPLQWAIGDRDLADEAGSQRTTQRPPTGQPHCDAP